MGYGGQLDPSYTIPSIIATPMKEDTPIRDGPKFNKDLDYYIGDEAANKGSKYKRTNLIKKGEVADWEGIEKFWHRSIHTYLRCEPENHNFVLTEPPKNSPENREQMAEIMFETFNVKGLFIGVQAILALKAQRCTLGAEN